MNALRNVLMCDRALKAAGADVSEPDICTRVMLPFNFHWLDYARVAA